MARGPGCCWTSGAVSASRPPFSFPHWATRRDPGWHSEEADRLRKEGQPQAAAFHAALAAGVHPGAVGDLRLGLALARSGRCPDAALALLRSSLWAPEDDFAQAR
jgi:hypothetical protein